MKLRTFPWLYLVASVTLAAGAPSAAPVLPFIEDDYEKALALAKKEKLPIFVEAWAPW
jgi:hypothetical protein